MSKVDYSIGSLLNHTAKQKEKGDLLKKYIVDEINLICQTRLESKSIQFDGKTITLVKTPILIKSAVLRNKKQILDILKKKSGFEDVRNLF